MQIRIARAIEATGWDVTVELTLRVTSTGFLVPDVAADPHARGDPYPDRPIALCIEVLSPGDWPNAVLTKCEEYHQWGVPFCWVIDPVEVRAWVYEAGKEVVPVSAGE